MKPLHSFFLLLAAGLMLAQDAPPPSPAKTTSTVEGKVVNSATGEPMRKVSVLLQSRGVAPDTTHAVQTGANGHFFIDDVDPGEYAISATREGFMVKAPGASGAPLPPVTVEKGQAVKDVVIPLIPLGVIAGRVMDEEGDPIRGAGVQAMQYGYVSGKRQLRDVNQVTANDKGEFRLWGLRPGTFYVRANGRNNHMNFNQPGEPIRGRRPPAGQAPTFYPSTTDSAHAVPVEVAAGAQLHGIDIRLRREALYAVHGTFPPEDKNQMRGGYNLQIMRRDGTGFNGMTRRTNDLFEFPEVLPGSYVIKGIRMDAEKRTYANQPVEVVNEDVDVGVLTFLPGTDVSGTVRMVGSAKLPPNLRFSLQPDDPSLFGFPGGEVKTDGSFVLHDVAPNIYQVNVGGAGTYVKSVQVGDRESVDRRVDLSGGGGSLTVALGSDVGQAEGSVQKSSGEPAVRARVVLIPEGDLLARPEFSRFGFTNEKGEYKIANISPGDYKMFAWEDVPSGLPQDAEFRKPFEKKGVPVKLDPNGQAKVDLTVISTAEMQQAGAVIP